MKAVLQKRQRAAAQGAAKKAVFSSSPSSVLSARRSSGSLLPPANAVKEVFMPALSSTMTEGKVVSWLKSVGDKVRQWRAITGEKFPDARESEPRTGADDGRRRQSAGRCSFPQLFAPRRPKTDKLPLTSSCPSDSTQQTRQCRPF